MRIIEEIGIVQGIGMRLKNAIKTGNVIPNTHKNKIWKLTSNFCTLFTNMKLTSNE
ncbi:hypothetical protein CHBNIII7_18190 [Haemophilus influenzae]|nr:hypothetical protein CHBNIII7_18190 [Haemophilus influenzae]